MSDQQPTPETPHQPEGSGPESTPAGPPPAAAPAGPTPPATPPVSAGEPAPPVWPAHNPPGATYAGGPPPPAPGSQPGYPQAGYPQAGYPQAGYPQGAYPYAPAQTTSTNAVVGLVLAVLSWVVCPVIPAIVALVLASKSAEEIAASQGRVGGEGLNTATKIISWINIGFYAALLAIGAAFFLIIGVLGMATS
jgi:hypothetical protein